MRLLFINDLTFFIYYNFIAILYLDHKLNFEFKFLQSWWLLFLNVWFVEKTLKDPKNLSGVRGVIYSVQHV